jgi:cytochrome c553
MPAVLILTLACLLVAAGPDDPAPHAADARDAAFFEARVRPVLVEHCVACHGPKKQEMGLRLDSRAALQRGGDAGPVVVPGDPDGSALVEAVRRDGPIKMPPDAALPAQAVADLTAWIKAGAPWPEAAATVAKAPGEASAHWAFQPVNKPDPPAARDARRAATPIDRFLLARLDEAGLESSPRAERATLIRRATFDLTGLPPTPEEVAAFEADPAPDDVAFARLVDRLLASPRYGERWGRYWLDVARYADTKGYVFEEEARYPWAYAYRDYVIRSLNEDAPYDRFLVEQLAADRLVEAGADRRALAALGFLTVGGRFMKNPHDIIDDRIDVVTRGLLGLTVTCARCHDHKYDPIPQADYYALYGVMASSTEPTVPPLFEPPPETEAYREFAREMEAREAKLHAFIRAKHTELVEGAKRRVADYLLAAHERRNQPATDEFMLLADGGDLNPVMIRRWQAAVERARQARDPVFALWVACEDVPADRFADEVQALLESDEVRDGVHPVLLHAFRERPPATLAEAAALYGAVLNQVEAAWQDYRRRAELEHRAIAGLPDPALESLRQVFHGPDAPPIVEMPPEGDLALLPDRASQATRKELLGAIEKWRAEGPGAPPRAMALVDRPQPVEPRIFLRGNPGRKGPAVPRRFLTALAGPEPPPFQDGSGRLELARAIADPANPLTARVLVNRVWMHHFGAPLVGTPSDFGTRGEPPTHPELLDWLAATLLDDGWSLKALHRRIMLSSAYQQASEDRSDALRLDPENRLLWRMNRRRLDFEAMRDALLATAGRLDGTLGGPPEPRIVDPNSTRRTLYGFLDRLNMPGLFRAFDLPDANATSPRRSQTTVPPQALFLMNHPFAREMARATLQRPEIAAETDAGRRIERLYRLLYGRDASDEETRLGRAFVERSENADAAWERYVHALLLANEFVFID